MLPGERIQGTTLIGVSNLVWGRCRRSPVSCSPMDKFMKEVQDMPSRSDRPCRAMSGRDSISGLGAPRDDMISAGRPPQRSQRDLARFEIDCPFRSAFSTPEDTIMNVQSHV